ncbi:hypothetical protein LTS10_006933 [Elasticomyces elasticus]|nr:hypothetical protein LTS10_006933 [Elasticomyces elasticus]
MSTNSGDSMMQSLERERQAIWASYPTEEARQQAWSHRKAQLVSYLFNDASVPRSADSNLDRQHPARTPPTRALSRATRKPSSMARSSSAYRPTKTEVQNSNLFNCNQHEMTYWPGHGAQPGLASNCHQDGVDVYEPDAYISKLVTSSELPTAAAHRSRGFGFDANMPPPIDTSIAHHAYAPMQAPTMSASTSMSSQPSHNSFASSEAMSRQSSVTTASSSRSSTSMLGAFDMMRVESTSSNRPQRDHFPLSFETHCSHASDAMHHAHGKPVSSLSAATPGLDLGEHSNVEAELLNGMGYGVVGQDLPFVETFPNPVVCGDQHAQTTDCWIGEAQAMERHWSQQSDWSTSSAASIDVKATERRRKHIENARQSIAPKSIPTGPLSTSTLSKMDDKQKPQRLPHTSTRHKEAISKTPYIRPQHPKLMCALCQDHPTGFRGEHELRRHYDRAHAESRKVWICVEPTTKSKEGWWPSKPVGICKQCKQQKQYNVYYNAAAHLRRAHFNPRKRGRKAKGEQRESRAGKAGGDWPPIEWLKTNGWLQEIEISSEQFFAQNLIPSQPNAITSNDILDDDDLDCLPETAIESQHSDFAAQNLGLQTYQPQQFTDFTYGCYPTPTDTKQQPFFPIGDTSHPMHATLNPDCLQAPVMAHTLSAPPAMQSTTPFVFDANGMSNHGYLLDMAMPIYPTH